VIHINVILKLNFIKETCIWN